MRRAMSPSPDELLSDPRVVWTEDVLRFRDTDKNGHVNNSVFSVLCESGRVNLFAKTFDPSLRPGTFFVIARLVIDFRAELHYPGRVRTATWVSRVGRSSMGLKQAIVSDAGVAADSEAVCVLMDAATRRPTPFPDAMRRIAEEMLRPAEA
jgi:acyl-CoA thioester hydrolase